MAVKEVSKSRSVTTLRSGSVRLWLEVESSQNGVLYIRCLLGGQVYIMKC